eukprot:Skav205483  [mRNA]  locus=scaffold830:380292:383820:+ [translate_table: standard]
MSTGSSRLGLKVGLKRPSPVCFDPCRETPLESLRGEPRVRNVRSVSRIHTMQEQRKPSITQVIENIGYGPSQILTGFLVNGSWLADGCELLVLSSISTILAAEWNLTPFQQGLLVSAVYAGVLVGNLRSGWVGDTLGRRRAVLTCFPIIAILSAISVLVKDFWLLLPMRFLVGFGFGLGQPSAVTILAEVSPARYRPFNQASPCVAEKVR